MTVTYDQTPGTKVILEAGSIQGIEVGEAEKLVIFAKGDPANGSAATNDPVQVSSVTEAENAFGAGTPIVRQVEQAINNGANPSYIYGVMPATQSVTNEAAAAVASYTLNNAPVIEDLTEITIEQDTTADGAGDTAISTEFRYDDGATAPGDADSAFLDPNTGQVEFDEAGDYYIDYKYLDWSTAIGSADKVVNESESGVFFADSDAESVASTLAGKVTALRDPDMRMVKGFAGAQPNDNSSEATPDPIYDTVNYADAVDDLPMWLFAPAREDDETNTLGGGIAGVAAGNGLQNPIYNEPLTDVIPETGKNDEGQLTHSERSDLRGAQVMPIKSESSTRIDGTISTDTAELWETDFQTVRVIDRCVIIVHEIGKAIRGKLDNEGTEEIAAQEAQDQLEELAQDGLLKQNTSDETNLYVRADDSTAQGTIALEVGVTPIQAVETFETTIVIA